MIDARPYSVRDLRSIFKGETLIRSFGGEYDYTSRRWRFSSQAAAQDARAFLSDVKIYTMHDPEAVRKADVIKRSRGIALDSPGAFSVVARNDENANRRGTAFFVFAEEEHRLDAQRQLFLYVRAAKSQVDAALAALDAAPSDFRLDGQRASELRDRLSASTPHRRDVFRVIARLASVAATIAPSSAAEADSRADVMRHATAFDPDFKEIPLTGPRRVTGLLVGRSAHHLAVQTDDDGAGVILDRWKIANYVARHAPTDLAVREATLQTQHAIGIDLDADGFGEATQIYTARHGAADPRYDGDNTDLYVGRLRVNAMLEARKLGVLPILQHEAYDPREDIDASIVASDDTLSIGLDAGAYSIIGSNDHFFPNSEPRPRVTRGPSYVTARPLSRTR
jgi:hypothetical protein